MKQRRYEGTHSIHHLIGPCVLMTSFVQGIPFSSAGIDRISSVTLQGRNVPCLAEL